MSGVGSAVASIRALAVAVIAFAVLAMAAASPAAAKLFVDSWAGTEIGSGSGAGQLNNPRGIGVNHATGAIYVADTSNNRVSQFDAANQFVRAWGRDVVSAGPGNADEQQLVTVNATAGTFTLTFSGQTTAAVPFDATAAAVQTALEDLSNLAPGDVTVTGGPGGAGGANPYLVQFGAAQADFNLAQMTASAAALTGTIAVATANEGATGAEICVAADGDVCKAGTTTGGIGGSLSMSSGNRGGVAVDQATGNVYVTNGGNLRIDQFTATGQFIRAWGQDVVTTGSPNNVSTSAPEVCDTTTSPRNYLNQCKAGTNGGLGGSFGSTMDGHPAVVPSGAPNAGNVVVADSGNRRVQEFTGSGGFVRAFGLDVDTAAGDGFEVCATAANCKASGFNADGVGVGGFATGHPRRLAVDGDGTVYTLEHAVQNRRVQKFAPAGTGFSASLFADALVGTSGGNLFPPVGIAVNSVTGHVHVARVSGAGSYTCSDGSSNPSFDVRVLELTSAGSLVAAHGECAGFTNANVSMGPSAGAGYSIAVRPSTGPSDSERLYVSSSLDGHRVYVLDDDGITPAVSEVEPASAITATAAALSGTVNPNSGTNTHATAWRLEYSRNGEDWTAGATGTLPAGATDQPISGSATGLRPNTLYRMRVVTSKPFGNPRIPSAELTFLTDAVAPELTQVRATAITDTAAELTAQVNPHSTPTSYRFEWGRGTFGNVTPVPDGSVGSGPEAVFVSQRLTGLQPGTTYQYRLVATSSTEGPSTSATQTFTTASVAPGDSRRAYELVSPADKVGGVGVGEWYNNPANLAPNGLAAHEGERFAAKGSFGSMLVDSGFAYANGWAFAERAGDQVGWRSHSPVTHPSHGAAFASFMQMWGANADLSRILWTSNNGPYVFDELGTPEWLSAKVQGMLVSDWGGAGVPARWEWFGPFDTSLVAPEVDETVLWRPGLSADGSHTAAQTFRVTGAAGPGDPTSLAFGDLVTGARSVYLMDNSNPPSDSFAPSSPRTLVNVCTGTAGADRTQLPTVAGSGDMTATDCPDALPGRDSRLISTRGASLTWTFDEAGGGYVSKGGTRVFFSAPDIAVTGIPNGTDTFCTTAGAECPPQLYVRQRNSDGSVTTRWISKAADGLFGQQDASLTGSVTIEGASDDGDKVYFRTNAPLTADDPNGDGVAPAGGVKTGAVDAHSWDLYMYDLPDGPDGDPRTPDADPGDGTLTRISAGPDGDGDCNVLLPEFNSFSGEKSALRFLSEDGTTAYFTCQAPLAGAAAGSSGTVTDPSGTVSSTATTNLYRYDIARPLGERWAFVANLPRSVENDANSCATTGTGRRPPLEAGAQEVVGFKMRSSQTNCVSGTEDGDFITFFTGGRLTADDPDAGSADIYGYDAASDELTRITAPQGGVGGTYNCAPKSEGGSSGLYACYGDPGVGIQSSVATDAGETPTPLGLATAPATPGERVAFFQSKSRLVPEDRDEHYDVYEWRDGKLSLLTTGAADREPGALYAGNDKTGRNVYFATRDALTWQDTDVVGDIYTARTGGGIPEPVAPVACDLLAGACQGSGATATPADPRSAQPAGGDADERRAALSLRRLSPAQRRRAALTGRMTLRVRTNVAGKLSLTAKAKLGERVSRVARASKRVREAGVIRVDLRLNSAAKRRLRSGKKLRLTVEARQSGARTRTLTVTLKRGKRS